MSEQSGNIGVRSSRLWVLAIVTALFVVLVGAKMLLGSDGADPDAGSSSDSITSVRNDAERDYDDAVASGKPIYVLFHSLS